MATALFISSTEAQRAAAGVRGRFHLATDTGQLSVDSGTAWSSVETFAEGFIKDREIFIPGTALAGYSRTGIEWPGMSTYKVKRVKVFAGTAPSGADGSNHIKVEVTDGTTTATTLLDSDVQSFDDSQVNLIEAASQSQGAYGAAPGGGNELVSYVSRITVNTEINVDQVALYTQMQSYAAGNIPNIRFFIVRDSDKVEMARCTQKAPTGLHGEYIVPLDAPCTLAAGTQYWVGFTRLAGTNFDFLMGAGNFNNTDHTFTTNISYTNGDDYWLIRNDALSTVDQALLDGDYSGLTDNTNQGAPFFRFYGENYPTLTTAATVNVVGVGTPPATAGDDLSVWIQVEKVT